VDRQLEPRPDHTVDLTDIAKGCRPAVYGLERGGIIVYIGASSLGVSRILSGNHHIKIESGDKLHLWFGPDANQFAHLGGLLNALGEMESKLIETFRPKFNKVIPANKDGSEVRNTCAFCGILLEMIRPGKKYCTSRCRMRDFEQKHPRLKNAD